MTPRRKPNPCGTDAGYQGHLRHGEEPCAGCLSAHSLTEVSRRRARTAKRRQGNR